MSRRFKTSKYKNAAPKASKQLPWIQDLTVGSYKCCGNYIKASGAFAAFNINPTGSQLGLADLASNGSSGYSILNAHSDLVTDFDFSPFEDGLLATGSADSTVKVWSISPSNLSDLSTLSPELVLSSKHRRVENVSFHPTSEFLLTYSCESSLTLWDILNNKEVVIDGSMHDDAILSLSWSKIGSLLTTTAKDKKLRVIDCRAKVVTATTNCHDNPKDSRVLWLGESVYILTTGFDSSRIRQVFIYDTRNFTSPIEKVNYDSSTGVLLPLYDVDTNMIFIAGRGDSTISYMEFAETEPYLTEGFRYNGQQTKGVCLVPKRALKVMETEVNRVLQLTSNSIIAIPYHVPRKTYFEFHDDLYPKTRGTCTSGSADTWMTSGNGVVSKISLDPQRIEKDVVFKASLSNRKAEQEARYAKIMEQENKSVPVPEPRRRKKSLGAYSGFTSYSDDPGDIVVQESKFFPVPKPRVSPGTQSMLRTPSSFLSRIAADFSKGSLDDDNSGKNALRSSQDDLQDDGSCSRIADEPSDNDAEQETDTKVSTVNSSDEGPNDEATDETNQLEKINGNHVKSTDLIDCPNVSTSDRRKIFETRSVSMQDGVSTAAVGPAGDSPSTNGSVSQSPKKLSVAERLKMFQAKNANDEKSPNNAVHGSGGSTKDGRPNLNSEKETSVVMRNLNKREDQANGNVCSNGSGASSGREGGCPAPISKPERRSLTKSDVFVSSGNSNKNSPETHVSLTKSTSNKRIDTVFGQVSKYRNFKAAPLHRRTHIENLRGISTTCPGESELIQANPDRVAVPLNTPGGKLAVFETSKPGRQPDGVIPALVHGTKIMDFMWDPFDNTRIAVGCDDGRISVWHVPEGGLKEQTNQPQFSLPAHAEKIYFVRFNPIAENIMATGSYDLTVRIWNLETQEEEFVFPLAPSRIQIMCFAWSSSGALFAIACKDRQILVYDPKSSHECIAQGEGPPGVRGGRLVWVLDDRYLIMTGFDRSSERHVHMYSSSDISSVANVALDVSPSILVPFYDEDSSILFLSGRGDSTIFAFDVIETTPYLRQLSHHRCSGAHQGISFLKKNACDVQNVEFAKAYRLTETAVEPWSFTVPRVKSEFFQDDLFPATKVLWEPTITANEWLTKDYIAQPRRVSLKPKNMKSVGEFNSKETVADKFKANLITRNIANSASPNSSSPAEIGNGATKKQQEQELEEAIRKKLPFNPKLEQDSMEGVDEDEWNEV